MSQEEIEQSDDGWAAKITWPVSFALAVFATAACVSMAWIDVERMRANTARQIAALELQRLNCAGNEP